MSNRISFDEVYIQMAHLISLRSEDPFTKVGCVATNDKKEVIGVSYNGLKSGMKMPDEFNLEKFRKEKSLIFIHAEANLLTRFERNNIHTIYCNYAPCQSCAALIAAHGVKRFIFSEEYEKDLEKNYRKIFNFYGIEYKKHIGISNQN